MNAQVARDVLVVAPQWIGDAVMAEPLLRRLHARGERITVGALPWVAPVFRAMPQVAEVIEFPFAHGGLQWAARREMARRLHGRFACAYVCPNSLKSALIPWWAGIPERVGYRGESRYFLINHCIPEPAGERPPMTGFYAALAGDDTVGDVSPDLRPRLALPEGTAGGTTSALQLPAHYVVMAPGAEYGPAKRWPAERFAQVARHLNVPVVLLGSAKESDACNAIADQAGGSNANGAGSVVNLAGRTTLDQAIVVIAGAQAMVSNDSGLMHVAAALDVPQVAIFGSSSPLHTPPLNPRARVLWLKQDASYQPPLDCAPCFQRTCPLGHMRCLMDIDAQRVLASLATISPTLVMKGSLQ